MSMSSANKFLKDAEADKTLVTKLESASKAAVTKDEKQAAFLAAAKAEGYDFTVDELNEAAVSAGKFSKEELDNVNRDGCYTLWQSCYVLLG